MPAFNDGGRWNGGSGRYNPFFGWDRRFGGTGIREDTTLNLPQFGTRVAECNPLTTQTAQQVMLVALGDASVRSVSRNVSIATWQNAILPNDGNVLGSDW